MTGRLRLFPLVVALAALAVGAGACAGDDDTSAGDPSPTTTTTAGSSTTAGGTASSTAGTPTTTTDGGGGAGCAGGGPAVPEGEGVGSGEIVDVDGDGRADVGWLAAHADGTRELGVATAAGGGDVVEIDSASPNVLTLLAVDADERPPVELFVSDGRTVELWAFADCALAPVTDPAGAPYLFDLGVRGTGTGIGCRESDGGRQLVGLNVVDDDGTTVEWTRTVIERDGLQARNGPTDEGRFERPADDAAIELLHTVSCGDVTITDDGIQQPPL
ncbi:MAG TPA: hypothetical protein VIL48_15985 [Acidimicrobiales bacterium]